MPPHRRDNTTPTARVSDRFGGMADLARALNKAGYSIHPSAIRHWQIDRAGNIPNKWREPILKAAKKYKRVVDGVVVPVRVSKRDMADV